MRGRGLSPLHSSLPAKVIQYKYDSLHDDDAYDDEYDNKYDGVDSRERGGGGGEGRYEDYGYYENKGGEDALRGGEENGSGGNFWVNHRGRLDEPGDGMGEGERDRARNKILPSSPSSSS